MDKQAYRERIWDELEETGEARFPFPPHGRIPNFADASEAAERLTETPAWTAADTIKANPDAPQLPVRRAALHAGKTVYMAVPRLREEDCFLELDPSTIDDVDEAATIGGASEYGVQVGPEAMGSIDLIVAGSVAVNEAGVRIGKGEGYSDLEFGILREFELASKDTPTATTVHELQVLDDDLPTDTHDVGMELVVTPERTIETGTTSKPAGVDWDAVTDEMREEIPILNRLEPGTD